MSLIKGFKNEQVALRAKWEIIKFRKKGRKKERKKDRQKEENKIDRKKERKTNIERKTR